MKLYITERLIFKSQNVAEEEIQAQEIVDYLREDFTIFSKVREDGFIEIEQQKVTLDEFKMNELFDQIFYIFKIEYGYMGGIGCDFNLKVSII
jgi:hypothetical protein